MEAARVFGCDDTRVSLVLASEDRDLDLVAATNDSVSVKHVREMKPAKLSITIGTKLLGNPASFLLHS